MSRFLFLLLVPLLLSVAEARFIDDIDFPDWANASIELVNRERIMTGYGDGRFAPDDHINRAQALTLIQRIMKLELEGGDSDVDFTDVKSGEWFTGPVRLGVKRGWITGHPDGSFRPADPVTRAGWAAILARAFELDLDSGLEGGEFYDVPARVWFTSYVNAMAENELIRFPQSNYYRPEKLVTRAEAAWTMAKILGKPRLMGVSSGETTRTGLDRRKVSVKPKDFNPNKQGYDLAKKEVRLSVTDQSTDPIILEKGVYTKAGAFEIFNNFDTSSLVESLILKLRLEESSMGPITEFEVKIVNDQYTEEIQVNSSGEAAFTSIEFNLDAQEILEFEVFLRAKADGGFYPNKVEGNFYIYNGGAIVPHQFVKTGTSGVRYAPVGVEERDISRFEFNPE